ncbi:MAG: hypothetical protein GYB67_05235 [Chloroflexi bacterium]|nr:hypothetical protein [Chloroflexota bacterium]
MINRRRLHPLFAVTGLLLVIAALYLPYIDRTMYCDEANTLLQYADELPRALFSYATPNNHILHSVAVWLMTTLAGDALVVVRFATFAGALLSVAMLYRIGSRLADQRVGIAAAVFMATTWGFAEFAVNARGYTLTIFFTLLLTERVFLAQATRSRWQRYSLLLISLALMLLLPSNLMIIGAAGLWIVWRAIWRRERRYAALLPPLVVGTAIGLLFYLPSFLQGFLGSHFSAFGETTLTGLLSNSALLIFTTPGIGLVFAAAILTGIAVILLENPHPPARVWIGVMFAAVIMIAAVQWIVLGRFFYARNYIFLVAPLALLAGVGASRVAGRWTLPLLATVLIASAIPLRALNQPHDVDLLLARIAAEVTPGDAVVVAPCFNAPIQYHLFKMDQGNLLFVEPGTEQVMVFTRGQPLDEVLALFGVRELVADCRRLEPVSEAVPDVYRCAGV